MDKPTCSECETRPVQRYTGKGLCNACYKRLRLPIYVKPTAETDIKPVGYHGAHMRVRKWRGRAKDQVCVQCGNAASEWAYQHGSDLEMRGTVQYSQDGNSYVTEMVWSPRVSDYAAMCRACHRVLDGKA